MMKTGIFGGSFNPIHNGHVTLARLLMEKTGLDEVWLMVSPQNPLKQASDLLGDEARLEMARAALKKEPRIIASDYEMHLPKPSYTWNTLQALSRDYPDREFVLMIGGDNWQLFDKWYHADDIKKNYQIVVYPREIEFRVESLEFPTGLQRVDSGQLTVDSYDYSQGVHGNHTSQFSTLSSQLSTLNSQFFPLLNISSTDIRRRIREGKSIRGLVPRSVEYLIRKRGYYV